MLHPNQQGASHVSRLEFDGDTFASTDFRASSLMLISTRSVGATALFCAAMLSGCATSGPPAVHGGAYEGSVEGQRFALSCPDAAVIDVPCRLEIGSHASMDLEFSRQPTSFTPLFRQAVDEAMTGSTQAGPVSTTDRRLLRRLDFDRCHPVKDSRAWSGDLLQMCLPSGETDALVVFLRGLCDRCQFVPVVLRRRAGG